MSQSRTKIFSVERANPCVPACYRPSAWLVNAANSALEYIRLIVKRYNNVNDNTRNAGNVTINTGISGDITIGGVIDLTTFDTESNNGYLKLVCAGTVTLASLDLDKVLYASLDSGSGASEITGAIADFDTTESAGSGVGAKDDPKIPENETRLRAPSTQTVYYEYQPGTLNDSLGGYVWQLKDLDGTSDGGLLMVEPPSGTVITIR